MPEQPRTEARTTTFPFSDLPLVAQRGVLDCFQTVPPYPYIRNNKTWAVSAWNIDSGISSLESRFGSQPDQSLIRDIHIGTLENHPLAKEWKEYLDVAKTRKSLLSVSKHIRVEWARLFWSTTTIHIGHGVPGSAHHVSPELFERTFLSKLEPRLLPFLRTIAYYPLADHVNLVGIDLSHGSTLTSNTSYFSGLQELGEIFVRYPDLAHLTNLSVFYRPLPQLVPAISEVTLHTDQYNRLRERWESMDKAGSWRHFEYAMSEGLLKGLKVTKEIDINTPEEGNVRTLIWWKLSFTKPI